MNIIAVDDEQGALNILMQSIQEAVSITKIHGFTDPTEALNFMKKIKCDIAFLDIEMSKMNGITLAKKLKEIYPQINIIFVTAYSQYANEAFDIHASGYVYKPVTKEKIIIEMENLRHEIQWKKISVFILLNTI